MRWTCDIDGSRVFDPADWTALTGLPTTKISTQIWLAAVHPDDRPVIRLLWREANKSGARWSVRYRLRVPGGGYGWVSDQGEPTLEEDTAALRGFAGTILTVRAEDRDALGAQSAPYLEIVADQILTARRLAERMGDKELTSLLEIVLFRLGQRLGRQRVEQPRPVIENRRNRP